MLLEKRKPFRSDTREQRIYLDHHLSDHKFLLRFLVSAVFSLRENGEREGCLCRKGKLALRTKGVEQRVALIL